MYLALLLCSVFSQPHDILLSINSHGNIFISWVSPINSSQSSYLLFSRYETISDLSALPKEGKQIKAKKVKGKNRVNLGQLLSEKLYIYQVGNDDSGWSPVYSFLGPVQQEQHYPNLAVLGSLTNSTSSFTVLSQLISRSFIARLDGVLLFTNLHDHPLYDTLQSNIPVMYVPYQVEDSYYSVQYYNTYLIFMNTFVINDKQIKWLKDELKAAQKYYWIIVTGFDSLASINIHGNFTEIFMDYHTNFYIHYGDFYGTYSIKYPLDDHSHLHFQETSELVVVQQGPSWIDKNLEKNSSSFATKLPGYSILNPKYSSCVWQMFGSSSHRLLHQINSYRIDIEPRKDEEVKKFKVVFAVTFIIILLAFAQNFIQKELEKRRIDQFRPLECGMVG